MCKSQSNHGLEVNKKYVTHHIQDISNYNILAKIFSMYTMFTEICIHKNAFRLL